MSYFFPLVYVFGFFGRRGLGEMGGDYRALLGVALGSTERDSSFPRRHPHAAKNLSICCRDDRGCLPTYERVGPTSTILLVICRLLQGVSVGGQLPASLIYTVETSPREHWGYYGSLVMMSGESMHSLPRWRARPPRPSPLPNALI